jgi:hypothetical protein
LGVSWVWGSVVVGEREGGRLGRGGWPTTLPQVPQLFLSKYRSLHVPLQLVPYGEQSKTVTVTVGVGAVEVTPVTPAQEQALLYRAVPEHALA